MPPRYAYWTILVDNLPTAFRSSSQEELMPTFNRLKEKNPSAEMKWWQNGKLWDSRVDAQEAMIARGELGRKGDSRQRDARPGGGFRDRRPRPSFDGPREEREERDASGKLGWKPKGEFTPAPPRKADREGEWKPKSSFGSDRPRRDEKPEWKPKGSFNTDRPARAEWKSKSSDDRPRRQEKSEWRPKSDSKPAWKPKGSFSSDRPAKPAWKSESRDDRPRRDEKPEWKPKGKSFSSPQAFKPSSPRGAAKPDWKSKSTDDRPRRSAKPEWSPRSQAPSPKSRAKLDWAPKGDAPSAAGEKRKWVPKEEYKKSLGIEAKRDKNWRPGGSHKDPRQKYKDAKKAKWGRFKEGIRKRWEGKQGAKPRKKKDDE